MSQRYGEFFVKKVKLWESGPGTLGKKVFMMEYQMNPEVSQGGERKTREDVCWDQPRVEGKSSVETTKKPVNKKESRTYQIKTQPIK